MAEKTLELTIQVFNKGGRRFTTVTAERFGYFGFRMARTAYEAIELELRSMLHDANTIRRGRWAQRWEQRDWHLRSLGFANHLRRHTDAARNSVVVGGTETGPAVLRPVSRTGGGIPIATTKKEMVEQVRSIVANVHRDTAFAALEEVLHALRVEQRGNRMNSLPVQGSVPS